MTDDPWRLSAIAHAEIDIASPLSSTTVNAVLDTMGDLTGVSGLDVGCGAGELLVRLAERGAAPVVGYDVSPYAVERARARVARRVPGADVTVLQQDSPPDGRFGVVLSVGSSAALSPGNVPGAIKRLRDLLTDDGRLLFADGYWKRSPDPAYLEALGNADPAEMTDLDGLVTAAEEAGLRVAHVVEVTEDDWEAYERAFGEGLRAHVEEHPDDPEAGRFLDRARLMREAYGKWGRDTLGFAVLSCHVTDGV